ncbi:class I SAM-dependent methyltransferase [Acinetobacter sp. CFCC 10889]|uniref:class I SAM-dependent methyltransferase n=1 Tax=Acinetobacter sp. CFCC 10889 TaxID=1775557 RepID=UPI000DD00DB5|nr:class I SAM-dependent methyltransferase [Acinetobacter sp. CFCC 10889]
MYVLSGKGSVAGADLVNYIVKKCQENGILWDEDLPEYTLDFLTQLPSVSKSIREKQTDNLISMISQQLQSVQTRYNAYMLLCFTAHQLIPQLDTQLSCVNLVDLAFQKLDNYEKIAFLGTKESLPVNDHRFILLENHQELIGDLITTVKRGYARMGDGYAGHPKKILEKILKLYLENGISKFFLACTDLHICKQYLMDFGIQEFDIVDIIEIAGDEIIRLHGRKYVSSFLDEVSDARTYFRYKYLSGSDSPQIDSKTQHFYQIINHLPEIHSEEITILDIGGSSSGHSITLANHFLPRHSRITLQDISLDSLNHAKSLYTGQEHIKTIFECGNIEDYQVDCKFDIVLCLGVLICISNDKKFESIIEKISSLMLSGSFLITRDGLTEEEKKIYMSFGGVIRNEKYYKSVFERYGFSAVTESSFIIDMPIYRNIRTTLWRKN